MLKSSDVNTRHRLAGSGFHFTRPKAETRPVTISAQRPEWTDQILISCFLELRVLEEASQGILGLRAESKEVYDSPGDSSVLISPFGPFLLSPATTAAYNSAGINSVCTL